MEASRPSGTAEGIAFMRALHLVVDDDPKIFADPLAEAFLSPEQATVLKTTPQAFQTPEMRSLRAVFVVRQRYAEDELAKALARGVSQYVILGAGLDSFAYRRSDLRQTVHVYEVDHPATQQWKRQRLTELCIALPDNLTFIPIDFEVQTLAAGMAASAFKHHEPAFFSWLGVTQYLTTEAVLGTLRYVASSAAPGSEIVFQIIRSPSSLSAEDQAVVTVASQRAAQHGEPWQSFFEPQALESQLRAMGFTQVLHFTAAEATTLYFQGRTDGLRLPNYFELIKARIGS
jgi:methyltransferase (TIGR00027 family)